MARAGNTVTLDVSGSSSSNPGASPLTFTWKVPPGITGAAINGAIVRFTIPTVAAITSYPFEVTVNDVKASASKTHSVRVQPQTTPGPTPNISGPDSVEEGKTLSLSGSGSSGSSLTYAWSAPDFTPSRSTASSVTVTAPAAAGSRDVQLTVRDAQSRTHTTTSRITVTASGGGGNCTVTAWSSSKTYGTYAEQVSYLGKVYRQNFLQHRPATRRELCSVWQAVGIRA
jgi:hypothetical protein